jgi:hypothetical protein
MNSQTVRTCIMPLKVKTYIYSTVGHLSEKEETLEIL